MAGCQAEVKLSSRASALKALMEGERAKVEQLTDGFAKFAEKAFSCLFRPFWWFRSRFSAVVGRFLMVFARFFMDFGAGKQVDGTSNQHLEDQLQELNGQMVEMRAMLAAGKMPEAFKGC